MKHIQDFEGWIGTDVSIDISLFEYGFLLNPNKLNNGSYTVVYRGGNDNFYYSSVNFTELSNEDWIDWDSFDNFIGVFESRYHLSKGSLFDRVSLLNGLLNYYGTENIFGMQYHEGFEISEEEIEE